MALSKEFYLDEIRSKHPNSYNESLKDLPIKDLSDMLDFLDEALGKADGGAIGIEVLFGPKRGEYQTGGRTIDSRATAQSRAAIQTARADRQDQWDSSWLSNAAAARFAAGWPRRLHCADGCISTGRWRQHNHGLERGSPA